ncbi:MAG: 50S ribosomal protein L9 [Coriobacteriia bacterium]|nr:50S ribosomal protein L9 [Coriobacteriia bacterium]
MKVILLTELKGRGGEGDVVEVKTGFAVNYLFPRKMAVEATAGNLKQLELRRHNIKKREDVRLAEAGDFRNLLDGKKVVITVKVGDAGRLFGSVTPMMIADAIKEQLGVEVDRRKIETRGIIKEVGEHPAEVAVYREIKADFVVDVVAEGAATELSEEEQELAAQVEEAKAGFEAEPVPGAEGAEAEALVEAAVEAEVLESAEEAGEKALEPAEEEAPQE